LVNREYFSVQATLTFAKQQTITRLSNNTTSGLTSSLTVTLRPFQLYTFRGNGGYAIKAITQSAPADKIQQVRDQLTWLSNLQIRVSADAAHLGLSDAQMAELQQAVSDANSAYAAGALWLARTRMERHELLRIYQLPAVGYPPSYRYPPS
jgi:hypothetical protein